MPGNDEARGKVKIDSSPHPVSYIKMKALLVFDSGQGGPVMGVWEGSGVIFDQ
jgi:hypothetical protein